MKQILKDNLLYFGLDNLEIVIPKEKILFLSQIVKEIDEDNTVSGYIELSGIEFKYIKTRPSGYEYGFKFDFTLGEKIIDAFSINFALDTKTTKNKNSLVIYSQLLTLEKMGNLNFDIFSFFTQNFDLKYSSYKRFDICADFSLPKSQVIGFFKKFKSKIGLQKDGFYETYYTREIQSDKNRLMITRIYDKKLDTFKKRKGFLYDHLDAEYVTRIELEVRPDYAKTVGEDLYDMLKNELILKKLFKKFINKDLKKDFKLKESDLKLIHFEKKTFDLSLHFQKLGFLPNNYMAQADGYAKNILQQTGYKGFVQYIFGNFFENDKKEIKLLSGKIHYCLRSDPELLFDEMIFYMKETLGFPQSKINKLLKPHLKTPILTLKK